jgi:hypothetical protein
MNETSQILLVVFVAVAAISLLMQAGFTVAIFIGARKVQKKLTTVADDIRLHALPVIMSSREVVSDLTPKIKTVADNLVDVSATLRTKAEQIGVVVGDVATRTQAVQAIEHGVAVPVRQVNGIINGLRAGVEVLRKKNPDPLSPEDDMFV